MGIVVGEIEVWRRMKCVVCDQAQRRCSRVQGAAQALGGGENLWMACATSAIGSGLREDRMQCGRLDRHRTHARHATPPDNTLLELTFRTGS